MNSNNKENLNIQMLANKAINGDKNAKTLLIHYYMPFIINHIETNYKEIIIDKDNLIQAGILGINDCLNYLSNHSSIQFSRYINSYIGNGIKKYIHKDDKKITLWEKQMLKGDLTARDKIINHYIKYIQQIIDAKCINSNYDKEELFQAGLLGIATALKFHKLDYKSSFSINVIRYINYYINKEIKKTDNNSKIIYSGIIEKVEDDIFYDYIQDSENIELIYEIINQLPKRDQEILYLYIYKNLSLSEIGKIYNVSYQRIQQIYSNNINYIKQKLKIKNNSKLK